jgi:phosphoribosylglycinamide formyltransferase-1
LNKPYPQREPPGALRILVLVSGNGTNLQALLDAESSGALEGGRIAAVIADREGAYALERARLEGVPAFTETPDRSVPKPERRRELSDRILRRARDFDVAFIIFAGFLSILEGEILTTYSGRIINIHPSLLPKFGGAGMYGERVHRAVLDAGETESGCTVHVVDRGTDTGPVLLQRKVPVLPGDTPETLAERIHREEHTAVTEAAALMIKRLGTGK